MSEAYKKAKSYAAALCSRSERCSFDVLQKLRKRELSDEECAKIIAFLKQEKYLDDARFAESYALDKFRLNSWGVIKIRMMLYEKQIPSNEIDKAIQAIPKREYLRVLKKVISDKLKVLKEEDEFLLKMKVARFAAGKGYEQDEIFKILGELV